MVRMGRAPQSAFFVCLLALGMLRRDGAGVGARRRAGGARSGPGPDLGASLSGRGPQAAEWLARRVGARLIHRDAEIGGRRRPQEHTFWVREQRAAPLWFRRQGTVVGYGYVRLGAGTIYSPQACTLGPIGARTPDDAGVCVLAAVAWAQSRAVVLCIDLPGQHPALAALLDAHFRITYVETFMSAAHTPFLDPRCYVGSGGTLF